MKGCVYILKSEDGRYYVGSTSNINRRMKQHQSKNTPTTTRMRNVQLILSQDYETLGQARNVEQKIKKLKRKDYIEKMIEDGFIKIHP